MVQFISFTSSSHASCFFILLKCNGCFGSHTFSFLSYPSTNFMTLSWVHSICETQWQKCTRNHKTLQICTSLHDRNMRNEKKGRGAKSGLRVTLHIDTCSSHNRIISLMQQPNTDAEPNTPLTLTRTQLLIHYMVMGPIHNVTIWCYVTQ